MTTKQEDGCSDFFKPQDRNRDLEKGVFPSDTSSERGMSIWNEALVEKPQPASLPVTPSSFDYVSVVQQQSHCQSSCISLDSVLEEKRQQHIPKRNLCQKLPGLRWLATSVYQKLFGIVFIANGAALLLTLYNVTTRRRFDSDNAITAAAANFFVMTAVRNEHLVNALYDVANNIARRSPPSVRQSLLGMIHHYGGIHSGCGVAGVVWYCFFLGMTIFDYRRGQQIESAVMGITWIVWTLLVIILIFAHPAVRARMHNQFEVVHRFAGWSVIGLFWPQTILVAASQAKSRILPLDYVLSRAPSFWFLVLVSVLLIYPWLWVRKRCVKVERISGHCVRLHFDFAAKACMAVKLSGNPLRENHPFACIPAADGSKRFSVIVSNAGDWTNRVIENPPKRLWVRELPMRGVLWNATMFRRVVVVATGSGIGPCLGLFNGCPSLDCRIVWSTRSPLETYGRGIIDSVFRADRNASIIDTSKLGERPNLERSAYEMYEETAAEAVFVISNQKLTQTVVGSLRSRGVSAFGPIWDS